MYTKECFKCGEVKPETDFYKHAAMADGLLGKCKVCTRADVRANRQDKADHYREYDRRRGNRQSPNYQREYRARFPAKKKAHRAVSYAVRNGKIDQPQMCSVCGGVGRTEAHHDDYSKPLVVRWLCAACHKQWHAQHGEAAGADYPCRVCGTPITTCELCNKCADGNDPFLTSKYATDTKPFQGTS